MAGEPPVLTRVRFGPFELFVESGELRKNGVRLKLSGQPIQVLSTLVASPGRVVTREELQHQLWPASSFGDFEKGLNAGVNRLRQNLNDSAHDPKYIETIPGRGYRFIAELSRPLEAQELGKTISHYAARRRPGFRLGVAALVLLLGLLSVSLFRYRLPKAAWLQKFEITRLTNGGKEIIAAISPDGRYVAFAEEELGTSDTHGHAKESLRVMQVAGGAQVEILPPAEVHYRTLSFSHDGQFLNFHANDSQRCI